MKKYWWVIVVAIIVLGGFLLFSKLISKNTNREVSQGPQEEQEFSEKTKFETFPVKFEDFYLPPKMYGLWPYGVKGNTSDSHNEGHPGWDFELKKGSKLYSIADLDIGQIHEGDKGTEVIEASALLGSDRFHITYHSVTNIEPNVKEGAKISEGEVLAEVGYQLSSDSAMIHFGIFPPGDSVGACPEKYFSDELQELIDKIVAISVNQETGEPYKSACVGKINKELYLQNYPENEQYLGGNEEWE